MTPHAVVDVAGAGTRSRPNPREAPVLLSCQGMRVSIDSTVLVDDIWFDIRAGEAYGLLGQEGAGKSIILAAVCGLLPTDAGVVMLNGHRLDSPLPVRTDLVGHTMQEAVVLPSASVLENLGFWARVYGSEQVAELMSVTGLLEHADEAMDRCSPGVRRALSLAVALLPEPRLLVVDELTGGVDREESEWLLGIVRRLRERGMSVLYAGRLGDDLRSVCDRVGLLDRGRLRAEGVNRPAA